MHRTHALRHKLLLSQTAPLMRVYVASCIIQLILWPILLASKSRALPQSFSRFEGVGSLIMESTDAQLMCQFDSFFVVEFELSDDLFCSFSWRHFL